MSRDIFLEMVTFLKAIKPDVLPEHLEFERLRLVEEVAGLEDGDDEGLKDLSYNSEYLAPRTQSSNQYTAERLDYHSIMGGAVKAGPLLMKFNLLMWKRVMAAAFDNKFFIYREKNDNTKTPEFVIILSDAEIRADPRKPIKFTVTSSAYKNGSYEFKGNSIRDRDTWVAVLEEIAKGKYISKKSTIDDEDIQNYETLDDGEQIDMYETEEDMKHVAQKKPRFMIGGGSDGSLDHQQAKKSETATKIEEDLQSFSDESPDPTDFNDEENLNDDDANESYLEEENTSASKNSGGLLLSNSLDLEDEPLELISYDSPPMTAEVMPESPSKFDNEMKIVEYGDEIEDTETTIKAGRTQKPPTIPEVSRKPVQMKASGKSVENPEVKKMVAKFVLSEPKSKTVWKPPTTQAPSPAKKPDLPFKKPPPSMGRKTSEAAKSFVTENSSTTKREEERSRTASPLRNNLKYSNAGNKSPQKSETKTPEETRHKTLRHLPNNPNEVNPAFKSENDNKKKAELLITKRLLEKSDENSTVIKERPKEEKEETELERIIRIRKERKMRQENNV